jgi:hypothetical protein
MKKCIGCLAIIVFTLGLPSYGAIRYVTETGAGALDGSSWANAYPGTSLQIAINSANPGDEVWVAAGTYFTTAGTDRTVAFSMKNGVAIFGSFAGTETLLLQRNITCGLNSFLSGDIGTAANTDNSYQVVRNSTGLDSSAVLDGFVISGGYDDRPATSTVGLGGGILNDGSGAGNFCNPTIRNCMITNNQAEFGAGIFNHGYNGGSAAPTIENCVIINNYATGGGGGIDNFGLLNGNAYPTIINTLIANNIADDAAGGMYSWGGVNGNAGASMYNVTMVNNVVSSGNGGGMVVDNSNNGAGIGGSSGSATINMTNTVIWGNTANIGPQFRIYGTGSVNAQFSDIDTTNQNGLNALSGLSINNLFINPQFLNPATPIGDDNCWMTDDDGYQLLQSSPCIHAGDSNEVIGSTDLAFNDRIMGTNVDMGAYEYTPSSMTNELFDPNGSFQVFPNPVMNELYIQADEPGGYILQDLTGYIVAEINLETSDPPFINTTGLPSGIYFLKNIKTGTYKKIVKL